VKSFVLFVFKQDIILELISDSMHLRRIRLRKEYRFKVWFSVFIISAICVTFLPKSNRSAFFSFFSKECRSYQQVFSRKLNDRIPDYIDNARLTGIEICTDAADIARRLSSGQLFRVRSSRSYKVEKMAHSYPCLTRESKKLLNELAKRFRKKVRKDGLMGSGFIITSMTRTTENLIILGKKNTNASDNSPHLNGNAFDISYARFRLRKLHVTECDKWYMKEALAEVIWKLRKEKKCWATYEKNQGCFHIVSR